MIYGFPRAEVKSYHWVIFVLLSMKPIQSSIQRASVSSWWRAGTPTVINESFLSGKQKTYHVSKMTAHRRPLRERWNRIKGMEIQGNIKGNGESKYMGGKSLRWSCIRNCSYEALEKLQRFRMRENNPVYKTTLHLPSHRACFTDWMVRCRRGGARSLKGRQPLIDILIHA